MCVPVCYICHLCAINESTTRQTANLVAVKYPTHRSVWVVNSEGAFDKTHDVEDGNQSEQRNQKSSSNYMCLSDGKSF